MMQTVLHTLAERPDLLTEVRRLERIAWPEFMHHAEAGRYWPRLLDTFAHLQLVLCDAEGAVIGCGNTIPLCWDGTRDGLPEGWDAAISGGVQGYDEGRAPDTLSALAAIVAPGHRGRSLSAVILRGMRALAVRHGLHALIAPVRPTRKHLYPLIPIERYAAWQRPDGSPFDPWVRTHWQLGARVLRPAPHSMLIEGSVAEWETWTGMAFPESGLYVVPGALQPVRIDRERDLGRYEDTNIWMEHPLGG